MPAGFSSTDWHPGRSDFAYEPATKLAAPQPLVNAIRTVSFPAPGEYVAHDHPAHLRQRDGVGDITSTTLLQNLARVGVAVR